MALRDLVNGFQQALGNVGNAISQGVQGVENAFTPPPPIQQPIPQQQSLVPPAPPQQSFMDWLGNAGKAVAGFAGKQVQNAWEGKNVFGQPVQAQTPNDLIASTIIKPTVQGALGYGQLIGTAAQTGANAALEPVTHNPMTIDVMPHEALQQYDSSGQYGKLQPLVLGGEQTLGGIMAAATPAMLAANPTGFLKSVLAYNTALQGSGELIKGVKENQNPVQIGSNVIKGITGQGDVTGPIGASFGENPITSGADTLLSLGLPLAHGIIAPKVHEGINQATSQQFSQDVQENDPNTLNHIAIAPFKRSLSIVNDPETQKEIYNAVDTMKQGDIGNPDANYTINAVSDALLPKALTNNLNTIDLARTWDYILSRVNGAVPEDVPAWMGKFDHAVFDTSGAKAMQAGKINFSAILGKEESDIEKQQRQLQRESTSSSPEMSSVPSEASLLNRGQESSQQPSTTPTLDTSISQRPVFNSKQSRAIQQSFTDQLTHIKQTAHSQDDLNAGLDNLVNTTVKRAQGDKTVLAGVRTALSKEMFGLAGENGGYKANYAMLQSLKDDPEMGSYITKLEGHVADLDSRLTSPTQQASQVSGTTSQYPNLTNRGKMLLRQVDESGQLPSKTTLFKIADENGVTLPETKGSVTNEQKMAVLDQMRQKGTFYEVNPQGTKSALREPPVRSIMEQDNTPSGNFEQEMEAKGTSPEPELPPTAPNDLAGKREDLLIRETLNRNPNDSSGTPLSNSPEGGLRDEYKRVYDEMQAKTPNDYGKGREAIKIVKGRESAGREIGARLQDQIERDLPNADDRRILRDYLDGSLQAKDVPKNVMEVAKQIRPLTDLAYRLRQAADSHIQATKDYVPRVPLDQPKAMGGQRLPKPLSIVSRENFHRDIAKFVSNDGKTLIGTTESLGLRPGDQKGVYVDSNGTEYFAKKAGITEIEDAGVQQYEKDAGKLLGDYIANTMRVKERYGFIDALRNGAAYNGEVIPAGMRAPSNYREVAVRGLEGYLLSPDMAKSVESFARKFGNTPLALRVYDGVANIIRNSIFYNFIVHPLNMYTQALIGSGRAGGPLGIIRLHGELIGAAKDILTKNDTYIEHLKNGASFDSLGKSDKPGMFARIGQKVFDNPEVTKLFGVADTLNPVRQLYRFNSKVVGMSDEVLRMGLYKTLESSGMSTRDAIKIGDKFMVDYGNTGEFEKNVVSRFLIFYPWAKGLFQAGQEMVTHPIQNAGTIANLALLYATFSAAQYALQQYTGNKDAKLRFPGMLGMIRDVTEAPGQAMQGKLPTIIDTHIAPIPKEIAQQLANKDFFTGKHIYDPYDTSYTYTGQTPPSELQARMQHLLTTAVAPMSTIDKGLSGKKSPLEIGLNQVGISVPHIAGYEAVPNFPNSPVNQPNAKPGTGIAAFAQKQQVDQSMTPQEQLDNTKLAQINAKLAVNPNDAEARILKAQILLNDSTLLAKLTAIAQNTAKINGTPLNPLYSFSPTEQRIILTHAMLPDGPEKTQFYQDHQAVITAYGTATGDYQNKITSLGGFTKVPGAEPYIPAPQPSAYVKQQMDLKNWSDPQVQQFLTANTDYKNQQRIQLGLTPLNAHGQLPYLAANASASATARNMRRNMRFASKQINRQFNRPIKIRAVANSGVIGKSGVISKIGYQKSAKLKKPTKLASITPTVLPFKISTKKTNPLKSFRIV